MDMVQLLALYGQNPALSAIFAAATQNNENRSPDSGNTNSDVPKIDQKEDLQKLLAEAMKVKMEGDQQKVEKTNCEKPIVNETEEPQTTNSTNDALSDNCNNMPLPPSRDIDMAENSISTQNENEKSQSAESNSPVLSGSISPVDSGKATCSTKQSTSEGELQNFLKTMTSQSSPKSSGLGAPKMVTGSSSESLNISPGGSSGNSNNQMPISASAMNELNIVTQSISNLARSRPEILLILQSMINKLVSEHQEKVKNDKLEEEAKLKKQQAVEQQQTIQALTPQLLQAAGQGQNKSLSNLLPSFTNILNQAATSNNPHSQNNGSPLNSPVRKPLNPANENMQRLLDSLGQGQNQLNLNSLSNLAQNNSHLSSNLNLSQNLMQSQNNQHINTHSQNNNCNPMSNMNSMNSMNNMNSNNHNQNSLDNDAKRRRRHRTVFTDKQLSSLETLFRTTQYPDVATRERLARMLDLDEERVEVWFKNRRAKFRRQQKDGGVSMGGASGTPGVNTNLNNLNNSSGNLSPGAPASHGQFGGQSELGGLANQFSNAGNDNVLSMLNILR